MARDGRKTVAGEAAPAPRRALPPFAALRAFEAVGNLGGIRRAAQQLGIDHAGVSRHIRALEEWVGTPLFDRDRGGGLSEKGAAYHARIAAALDDISKATADLTRRGDDHRLLIWCVPGFAFRWLNARIAEFSQLYPEIDIEVRPTDQGPDLSRHEADADIRYFRDGAAHSDAEIEAVEIARPVVVPLASPAYAAGLPHGTPVEALLGRVLLHEDDDTEWRAWLTARGVPPPARLPGPRLWHAHLTLDAARRGQGVVLSNALLIGDELDAGHLVELRLTPAEPEIRLGAYVFRARRDRWRDSAIVKFRRWLEKTTAG